MRGKIHRTSISDRNESTTNAISRDIAGRLKCNLPQEKIEEADRSLVSYEEIINLGFIVFLLGLTSYLADQELTVKNVEGILNRKHLHDFIFKVIIS